MNWLWVVCISKFDMFGLAKKMNYCSLLSMWYSSFIFFIFFSWFEVDLECQVIVLEVYILDF
jgi:hypothetical protein